MRLLPKRGIASETCGRVSATKFKNTVRDSRIVTPKICKRFGFLLDGCCSFVEDSYNI